MSIIVHILIGCPSSGKSTLAQEIIKNNPNCRIISTDEIRANLFGDATIQGDWTLIEREIFTQFERYIKEGNSIVYDATNSQRYWRIDLLQKLTKYNNINCIGWYLKTPLELCQKWNLQRNRQVPAHIITQMYQSLRQFPPLTAEGFSAVYDLPFKDSKLDINIINDKLTKFDISNINRSNRTLNSKVSFHPYSKLVDFDRLMHLISVIIKYPTIGNLSVSNPTLLRDIFGEYVNFESSLEEICAILAKHSAPLYANSESVSQDLAWLEKIGIINNTNYQGKIEVETRDFHDLVTHPYSDQEAFERLINTINFIVHYPFIFNKEDGCLQSLINAMISHNIININCADSIRKDFERVLKPFHILPDFTIKKGYFIGTGILAHSELIQVFRLLEAQSKSLSDPLAFSVYETLKNRLGYAKIAQPELYPVRAINNKNIVDFQSLPSHVLATNIDQVEWAIENGELLELKRLQNSGTFNETDNDNFFFAYPLQLVFHNIGWYLGYEEVGGENNGLLKFERLDRLFLGRKTGKNRSISIQQKTLTKLQKLSQCSGGIFLGNDVNLQRLYLDSKKRKNVEIKIELWFNDNIFKFISEGTNRFPLSQMKMSPPLNKNSLKKPPFILNKTGDPTFPNRFQVTLPVWSLDDVDLLRWIVGFGGQVKVIHPPELMNKVKLLGEAIANLY